MTPYFRRVHDVEEAKSTSDLAREMLDLAGTEVPFIVRARRQTAGRGRGDNRWWSDEGSLTFTLAIDPAAASLERRHEPMLALAVAVGVVDALESCGPCGKLAVRWPNDLEADGKKLGGILPERIETGHGPRILLGIGLNISTQVENAPAEVRSMATSMRRLGFAPTSTDEVFRVLKDTLPLILSRLADNDPALTRRWTELDSLRGQQVRLRIGDVVQTGVGAGITPDGGLSLLTPAGRQIFHGGQVLR